MSEITERLTGDRNIARIRTALPQAWGAEAYRRPAIGNIVRNATISNCAVGTRAQGTGTTFTNITRVNCTVDADGDE